MENQNQNSGLPEGIRIFSPRPGAPDFVLGSVVVSLDEFFNYAKSNPQFLSDYQGRKQLKLQVLRSKAGNTYMSVDTYGTPAQPQRQAPQQQGWGAAQPQQSQQQQQGWGAQTQQPFHSQQALSKEKPDDLPF